MLLLKVLLGLVVLGILIVVHELGHFLVAKLTRVGVVEFSIGFGRKIWQRRIRGTRYSIGAIPLGGYVRMVGDDPREACAMGTPPEGGDLSFQPVDRVDDPETAALLADRSRWFLERGFFTKSAIVIAGPGFNFLFAILLSVWTFYYYGAERPLKTPVIGETIPDYPAAQAGLRPGDRVVSINGKEPKTWQQLAKIVHRSGGDSMHVIVERTKDGQPQRIELDLRGVPENPELALVNGSKRKPVHVIGISPSHEPVSIGLGTACVYGVRHVWDMTSMSVRSFGLLITGAISPKNIGGPISIMRYAAQYAEKGIEKLYLFIIFLSVSLAILNLLPIPILDGGHLVFFMIEAVKGSPVNLKAQEIANQVGLVLLLALMFFAVGNDVVRFFE